MATSVKKKPAAKAAKKGFEETLWDSANKLRGSVESSEYKHIVLSLIFLKFISDKLGVKPDPLSADAGCGKTGCCDSSESGGFGLWRVSGNHFPF